MMSERQYVAPISEEAIAAMRRKSAASLPDDPTSAGMKANDIKKRFWSPVLGDTHSLFAELGRVIGEINAALGDQTGISDEQAAAIAELDRLLVELQEKAALLQEQTETLGADAAELEQKTLELAAAAEALEERLGTLEREQTVDHRDMTHRDAEGAHPMSAIEGLLEALGVLEDKVAKLLDEPIVIQSFKSSHGTVELGRTVDVTLSWSLSEEAKAQVLDGVALSADARSKVIEGVTMSAPGTKKWVLEVVGEFDEEVSGSASVTFANGIYYGAAAAPEAYDGDFIGGLSHSVLRNSKLSSFTVTADGEKYIYYCLPVRLGKCVFSYGANEGGVTLVDTVLFENASGYKEDYYIYRSDESGLGNTTLGVK